jgi:hypothetical protein
MTEPLAVCRNPTELQLALRARAEQLQLARYTIDGIAGLAEGHSAKLLTDPPKKNLGPVSIFSLIAALGLSMALIEDQTRMERIQHEPRRNAFNVRSGMAHWRHALAQALPTIKSLGRRGGKRRAETLSPERRSAIAKRAARARWRQSRQAKKLEGREEHEQRIENRTDRGAAIEGC